MFCRNFLFLQFTRRIAVMFQKLSAELVVILKTDNSCDFRNCMVCGQNQFLRFFQPQGGNIALRRNAGAFAEQMNKTVFTQIHHIRQCFVTDLVCIVLINVRKDIVQTFQLEVSLLNGTV